MVVAHHFRMARKMDQDLKMPRDFSFRRYRLASILMIILFILFTLYGFQSLWEPQGETLHGSHITAHALLPLPEYQSAPGELAFCAERFGLEYLQGLSNTSTNYCNSNSRSSLTCFRSQTVDKRIDPFCVGGPASSDSDGNKFELNCELREWTARETADGIPKIDQFPSYWYETGPHYIFNKYIGFNPTTQIPSNTGTEARKFSILIKREEKVFNVWHSLMEITAYFMTIDVMRMTKDPATGRSFFSTEDIENTQVMVLDDHPDGPFYDLWSIFAKRPTVRFHDDSTNTTLNSENIIIPLPGGSNPLWQGDWKVHNCEHSALWHTLSQRVLNFYKIDDKPKGDDESLVLTFIDRKDKRRLIDKALYLEKLKSKFPALKVQSIDFAGLSFPEQLNLARRTDILVGVHGAGLTHSLFMRPGSAMVEIMPENLDHKGFRNLAKLLGHHYFSSRAIKAPNGSGDWQNDDVVLEEDRFMGLVEVAVKSMYNRGLLNIDITK